MFSAVCMKTAGNSAHLFCSEKILIVRCVNRRNFQKQ